MLPPEGVLLAVRRWIELLMRGESRDRGWAIIRNSPSDAPLTATQYATALEWLTEVGVLDGRGVLTISPSTSGSASLLLTRCIESLRPPWLVDADILISDPADVPIDAARLADLFALSDSESYLAIQNACRKVDTNARALIGARGELALIDLIEKRWPGSTTHVSSFDDGAGYDVAIDTPEGSWHLEVKTTTRKGRLTVYLSRNEFATYRYDSSWLLVIVGMEGETIRAISTLRHRDLLTQLIPRNLHPQGRWEVCALDFGKNDLVSGLVLDTDAPTPALASPTEVRGSEFSWMPSVEC